MEHRCSVRKPIKFQVLLYKHGIPVQAGICRNLGLGGMFVESAGYEWRKNERLEIELLGADRRSAMRLPGVVVHHSAQGAGVMFDVISNEQRRALRVLLARLVKSEEAVEADSAERAPRAVA
ncbi:MAG: PilZ domain-containing protein [Thiogranum sp.]|nr:PilZ domain-containing protein [Thiogranum sp.]